MEDTEAHTQSGLAIKSNKVGRIKRSADPEFLQISMIAGSALRLFRPTASL